MKNIGLQPDSSLVVPRHLFVDGIRQFTVVIDYRDEITQNEVDDALGRSGIAWDSISYDRRKIWGGNVFRIPDKKGYWVLQAPCLYCYGEIASNTTDDAFLSRCAILAYL